MRHRMAGRKLGRTSSHRKALLRTMVTEFLENEKMVTTVPKAKELRSVAEKMITLGKKDHLHAKRQALSFIRKKSVVFKLFDTLAPRFADRNGGYTRILRLGPRPGDNAEMAILEFVDAEVKSAAPAPEKKAAAKTEKAPAAKKAAPKKTAAKKTAEKKDAAPKKAAKEATAKKPAAKKTTKKAGSKES